ncbi:MAG: Fe-S cluster assembly ATPase SufC [Candidatus Woykebacteria bacterium RBG_13_40_15]|uniref:Fe-S cluster assembly ATPase SufC n=1 Tax=Candidatus Woykebacteria bacterium RBG_13_40_15 TaxID=1802593 RepID=A0A1G1W874_9BACT|nr:MAG: Fe-S cluster assembly ATPase SufC [Candidatus Woykebacteria bacterium RBG_13_40_15]
MLEIKDVRVSSDSKEIVRGINLKIKPGEINILMGPNASGKSTLSLALAGHPNYKITSGKIILDKKDITNLNPDKRAKRGLFLGMQYPISVPGVSVVNFLRSSYQSVKNKKAAPKEFIGVLDRKLQSFKFNESLLEREVNEGFSGGEKKKFEILQLELLKPKYAILDEPDSGLDIDALSVVATKIKQAAKAGTGILLITHYQRILKYLPIDCVHVLFDGRLIESGGQKLAQEIENKGYKSLVKQYGK